MENDSEKYPNQRSLRSRMPSRRVSNSATWHWPALTFCGGWFALFGACQPDLDALVSGSQGSATGGTDAGGSGGSSATSTSTSSAGAAGDSSSTTGSAGAMPVDACEDKKRNGRETDVDCGGSSD